MYKLNCIVLGDDPSHNIFVVDIAPKQTVADLKDLIKDKKKPEFDHVAADRLKLWKVKLPVDDALKNTLESLELNKLESPSPVKKLQKVFSEIPEDEHLHIVIQGPHAVSSEPLHLNCIVFGDDPTHIFPVSVAQTRTVGDLRKVIKEEKKRAFRDVDADSLKLWKVNLPFNDALKHTLETLELAHEKELSPVDGMLEVFGSVLQHKRLHIVIQPLPADDPVLICNRRLPHS
ncbi:hypothetical protein BDR05DRAFT_624489 [Suillus weaverae]|nr:hypothetical protein BDR05DRAFT_624489 [Suillus weaverae]